jgi:hypothetical protein
MIGRNPQVCTTIPEEAHKDLIEIMEKTGAPSISHAASVLLQYAIKEKKRNRNGNKGNNSERDAPDSRASNPGG